MDIGKLDRLLKSAAPTLGVSIGDENDKSTWRVDFDKGVTDKQKDAAQAVIDAFDVAAPVVPASITPKQGKSQLLAMGLMTFDEAIAGEFPAFLKNVIAGLPKDQGAAVAIAWREAIQWDRDDPIFAGGLLAAAAGALKQPSSPELVDQFFLAASQL